MSATYYRVYDLPWTPSDDEGPLGEEEAERRLRAWWADRQATT